MAISKVVYKSSPSATPVTWMDATSATAAAADITSPKTAMLANGVVTQGTGSGGGGGLEYEEGTYTPVSDTENPVISFANTHNEAPIFFTISDCSDTSISSKTNVFFSYVDSYKITGQGWPNTASTEAYGNVRWCYFNTSGVSQSGVMFGYNSDNAGDSTSNYPRFFAKETAFYPHVSSSGIYWRSGRTYKWIAVWK